MAAGWCILAPLILGAEGGMGTRVVTVNDVLDGHVALDIECLDRIYLNGYVPILQSSGQVVAFLCQHLGYPFPSPALFDKIGQRFRAAVASFAQANSIPWVKFGKDDRKVEVMRPHLERQAATGRSGVAAIGVAQEFQRVWTAYERPTRTGRASSPSPRPTGVSPATTSTCGTPTSARRSSRSAATSPTRSRSGSTATSGPNAKPPRPGWPSASCPTGLGPAPSRSGSRRSATGSGPPPSTSSCSAGWLVCRCRWARRTGLPATGGSARCGRSKSPRPWCSTRPPTPAASS